MSIAHRSINGEKRKNDRRIYRKSNLEDWKSHADLIERSIIDSRRSTSKFLEGVTQQQRRRESSSTNSNHSHHIDRLLEDENNDWFFEKILEKFEDIRSKKVSRYERSFSSDYDRDHTPYGIERIVERRYYVKKPRSISKRNQLTSTSDLTTTESKNRLNSGVSTVTAATTLCSQCLSTTPTYVDDLRDQSDTLRNEINGLKNDIEQLQISQQEFLQKLENQFQSSASTTSPQRSILSRNSPIKTSFEKDLPVRLSTGRKSRSTSTQSQDSSSSNTSTTTSIEPAAKPNITSSSVPAAPIPIISEFIATKNPSIAPGPTPDTSTSSKLSSKPRSPPVINEHISSESSSRSSTPLVNKPIPLKPLSTPSNSLYNQQNNSKPSSTASTPIVNVQNNSKLSSTASTPLVNGRINPIPISTVSNSLFNGQTNSKSSSTSSTPTASVQINVIPPSTTSTPLINTQVNSNSSSVVPTPLINEYVNFKPTLTTSTLSSTAFQTVVTSSGSAVAESTKSIHSRNSVAVPAASMISPSASSTRVPIYENELAYRRVLSPRSQIVASSGSIPDSSDSSSSSSSSGSASPELITANSRKDLKASVTTLHGKDLNDLVQYSSQLELSGFPSARTPIISNPNQNSSFWNSVDEYIENVKTTNINIGLPPIPRPMNHVRSNLNNRKTKQLDKYDLEIKPQEFIGFSAPLLMPPLDILP